MKNWFKEKASDGRAKLSSVKFEFTPCMNCGIYREVIMNDDGKVLTYPDRSYISPDSFT
jgi:hypothetical protein